MTHALNTTPDDGRRFFLLDRKDTGNFADIGAHLQRLERAKAHDSYVLQEALRPTSLHIVMSEFARITPLPILSTYRGKNTGHEFTAYINL